MRALKFHTAVAGLLLALAAFPNIAAAAAPANGAEQAVQAYAAKQRADQQAALDQGAAARAAALLRDPASPVLGNPQAQIAVVEFFDYACPYCKAADPRLKQLLKTDKNVKLILKEYPILTPESLVASKAALAAARQGKYPAFHQALMDFRGRLTNEAIFDTAKIVGLDIARLRKDMDAPEIADEIIANFNLARGMRIFQTPTYIVGTHVLTEPSAEIDFAKEVAAARGK